MPEDLVTISLGLPELKVTDYRDDGKCHHIWAEKVKAVIWCPHCGARTPPENILQQRERKVSDLPISGKPVILHIKQRRFRCPNGHRFWERFDTVAFKQRQTRRLQQWLLRQASCCSVSQASRRTGFGYRVIERLLLCLGRKRASPSRPWPRVIGVDEYSFRKGHNYDTVVVDLRSHEVFEVSPGRTSESLGRLFCLHPGIKRLRAVVMDMWRPYLKAIRSLGRRVMVAVDRFHVERHVWDAVDEVRKRISRQEEAKALKKASGLFKKPQARLSQQERLQRQALMEQYPQLCLAVRLAEELHSWYETTKDKHRARAHLLWWLGCVAESGIEELKEAAKAIRWWFEYILNYFEVFLTNGTVEGFNTKIKLILRMAFGLPCFEHRRARIIAACCRGP